jgi:PAS domain S-box-containing protein
MLSLTIFIIQLWLFALVIIGFHRLSPRLGLAPFLFLVAGMVGLMNVIELNFLQITPMPGIELRPGGHVYVPLILLVILILYVTNGTRPAQIMLYGLIGINVMVFVALVFLSSYLLYTSPGTVLEGGLATNNPFDLNFIRGMVASIAAFAANMFVIIVVYQGICNAFPKLPHWIAPGIALVLALWTDSAVYNLGAYLGTERFILQVPSDTIMKTLAGLLIWPLVAVYLEFIAPKLPDFVGSKGRPTFDIFFRNGQANAALQTLETELRISRSIYRQLTQNIEEIFWLVDIESKRFLYISPAFERITGYQVDRFYKDANALLEIVHPEEREFVPNGDVIRFLIRSKEAEFRLIRADSSARWLRARSFPVKDELGELIRFAGLAEDITEQKKATEDSFQLALAEERMRILHDFIRDASHDLKTPLSAMLLKIELMEKVTSEERRQELRSELKDRAIHLSDLIDDLFTLSRIEGHEQIRIEQLNFTEIVQKVSMQMQPLADSKGLLMIYELGDEACTLEGEAEQVERVVNNLIANAIRYTEKGTIEVKTQSRDKHIIFEVKDTGIGIPEAETSHIFERFFRSANARASNKSGTGLGLAITKAIVERHHGQIHVESNLGAGTRFIVELPVQQPRTHDDDTQNEAMFTQEIHPIAD